MSSSMDPGPKLRLLTNVLLLSDRSGRSRTFSPPLPPFRPRQAVGLVGILVRRSRELEIAVGTVFGFDDRLDRLLRTLTEHQKLIREAGAQGVVLLKNEKSILPLKAKELKS